MKQQLLWFLLIGAAGFVMDAGITHILAHAADLHPVAARIPAILVAVLVTYILNRNFTFKARAQAWLQGLLTYAAAQGVSQAINFSIYSALVLTLPLFRAQPVLAVAAGSIVAMMISFCLYKFWVFRPRESDHAASQ